jgi:hypothetical protein
MHTAGEPWSGVFWEIRTLLGCADRSAKCTDADTILLASWKAAVMTPAETIDVRLARAIIDGVRQLRSPEKANIARAAFVRRGLNLSP